MYIQTQSVIMATLAIMIGGPFSMQPLSLVVTILHKLYQGIAAKLH